jgi:hypothetical protein
MSPQTQANYASANTRRSALGFSLAALAAGLTVPAIAASGVMRRPDAELIDLCDQLVAAETEQYLLGEHDEHASDFGPNNSRYEQLSNERERLVEMIDECQSSTTPAGHVAMARAALTWAQYDDNWEPLCDDFREELMVKLAQGVAAGFVWPPPVCA